MTTRWTHMPCHVICHSISPVTSTSVEMSWKWRWTHSWFVRISKFDEPWMSIGWYCRSLLHYVISHASYKMVHQHKSFPNASLKIWVFNSFSKVSVFVSSGRLDGREFHAYTVRRTRNSARRTLVSTVEVHIGSCWRISISHDQSGQPRMSSCPTCWYAELRSTRTRCMSMQSLKTMRNLIGSSGGLEWCGPRVVHGSNGPAGRVGSDRVTILPDFAGRVSTSDFYVFYWLFIGTWIDMNLRILHSSWLIFYDN